MLFLDADRIAPISFSAGIRKIGSSPVFGYIHTSATPFPDFLHVWFGPVTRVARVVLAAVRFCLLKKNGFMSASGLTEVRVASARDDWRLP